MRQVICWVEMTLWFSLGPGESGWEREQQVKTINGKMVYLFIYFGVFSVIFLHFFLKAAVLQIAASFENFNVF